MKKPDDAELLRLLEKGQALLAKMEKLLADIDTKLGYKHDSNT